MSTGKVNRLTDNIEKEAKRQARLASDFIRVNNHASAKVHAAISSALYNLLKVSHESN